MKINGPHSDLLNQKPGASGPAFCVGTNLQVLWDKAWKKLFKSLGSQSWPHIGTPWGIFRRCLGPGWHLALCRHQLLCSPYGSQAVIAGVLQSLVSVSPVRVVVVSRKDSGFGIRWPEFWPQIGPSLPTWPRAIQLTFVFWFPLPSNPNCLLSGVLERIKRQAT